MNADDYVQINVTDNELAGFPEPEHVISPTLKLQQCPEILSPSLPQMQSSVIATSSIWKSYRFNFI